jgi:hypothetical protein
VFSVMAAKRNRKKRPMHFLGWPMDWCKTVPYFGATTYLDGTRPPGGKEGTLRTRSVGILDRNCRSETVLLYKQIAHPIKIRRVRPGGSPPAATSGNCVFYHPSAFALRLTHFGKLLRGNFTNISEVNFSSTTSKQ